MFFLKKEHPHTLSCRCCWTADGWIAHLAMSRRLARAASATIAIDREARARSRAVKQGGFKQGGFPNLDLSFLFCPSFFVLPFFCPFWDFPDFSGDFLIFPGIFPIGPFPFFRT